MKEDSKGGAPGEIPSDILSLELDGPVEFRHTFLDMRSIQVVASEHTREGRTCLPAMGMAFAAGTTDGECGELRDGEYNFIVRCEESLLHAGHSALLPGRRPAARKQLQSSMWCQRAGAALAHKLCAL